MQSSICYELKNVSRGSCVVKRITTPECFAQITCKNDSRITPHEQRVMELMMKKISLLFFLFLIGSVLNASAFEIVNAKGCAAIIDGDIAAARDQAVTAAQIRAIEQVVGVEVDSQATLYNTLMLDAWVKTTSSGLVQTYEVLNEWKDENIEDLYWVECKVVVETNLLPDNPNIKDLRRNHTNAVSIKEKWQPKAKEISKYELLSQPYIENYLVRSLLKDGYEVINTDMLMKHIDKNILMGEGTASEEAIRKLGDEFLVDLYIKGEVTANFSQYSPSKYGGLYSYRAAVTLEVYETSDGKYITTIDNREWTGNLGERGFGASAEKAARTAIQNASKRAAEELMEYLNNVYATEAGWKRPVTITVLDIPSHEFLERIINRIKLARWVEITDEEMARIKYDPERVDIPIRYGEKIYFLSSSLNQDSEFEVLETTRNSIKIKFHQD